MSSRTKRFMIIIIMFQLFGFITGGFSMAAFADFAIWMFVLFGIGWITYLSRSFKSKGEETQYGMVCPSCDATIGEDEERCPYCGHNFSPQIECEYCSTLNSTSNSRCSNCNAMLH